MIFVHLHLMRQMEKLMKVDGASSSTTTSLKLLNRMVVIGNELQGLCKRVLQLSVGATPRNLLSVSRNKVEI